MEKKHDLLDGSGPLDLKRRNALTNALIDLLGDKSGADTLLVRECLYAIAPPELWQFYSAQGLSGSCKSSFYGRMIHIYKAVLVAVVSKTGKDKSAIVRAISEVLKTVHNRAGPEKYRKEHPEEMLKHSVGQQDNEGNLVADFAKKSVKGRKRPAIASTSSAEEPAKRDVSTAPDVDSSDSDTQHHKDRRRRNAPRKVQPLSVRAALVEESDVEPADRDLDDSDVDSDYHPPTVKLFKL